MYKIAEHVLYEDDKLLVCVKPAGIAVQTKRMGEQDMESLLRNYLAAKGETPFIGIIHRLDQPVEGNGLWKDQRSYSRAEPADAEKRFWKILSDSGIWKSRTERRTAY